MPYVYGYGRVSTKMQSISIAAQEEHCKQFYEFRLKPKELEWGGFYSDSDTSGATPFGKREAGGVLLNRMAAGDHVIFAKMDRAFRSLKDQVLTVEQFQNMHVTPHFIDAGVDGSTPMGRFLLQLLAGFAELERERIKERINDAFRQRKAMGLAIGGKAPYGFKIGHRNGERYYDPNVPEQQVMRKIYELRERGHTLEEVWRTFRMYRITNRKGNEIPLWNISLMEKKYRQLLAEGKLHPEAMPRSNPGSSSESA